VDSLSPGRSELVVVALSEDDRQDEVSLHMLLGHPVLQDVAAGCVALTSLLLFLIR